MNRACLWSVLLVLLAADFAGAGPRKVPDACALLTDPDNSSCAYMKSKSDSVTLAIVPLGLNGEGFTGNAAVALKEMQATVAKNGVKTVPVEGAGEGAFFMNTAIHFGKGPWHAVLVVVANGKPDFAAEQKIVKLVYSRIP